MLGLKRGVDVVGDVDGMKQQGRQEKNVCINEMN